MEDTGKVADGTANAGPLASRRPLLLSWLWPVPVGLLIGTTILAPFARGPGDPSGHVIGAGLGGLPGLALALAIRAMQARRRTKL